MRKKIRLSFVLLVVMFATVGLSTVRANSNFHIVAPANVNPGQTFTVSIGGNVGAGRFDFSINNGSASTSSIFIPDNNSITVKAGNSGVITITANTTTASTPDYKDIVGSQVVSVKINTPQVQAPVKPQTPSNPQSPNKPVDKPAEPVIEEPVLSADNTLKSIEVSKGKLYPKFKPSRTNYSVVLPKGTNEIDIKAVTNHPQARVANTGKHKLKLGENGISLIVTPENKQSEELYKIMVYVEDELKDEISYGEENFKVVNHFNGMRLPDTFEKSKVKLNGKELPSLKSKVWNAEVLYLEAPDKTRGFYLVEKDDSEAGLKVISELRFAWINGEDYLALDIPQEDRERLNMSYEKFKIDKEEFTGLTYTDKKLKDFKLVYLQDKKGNKFYYQYDAKEKTWQRAIDHVAITEEAYQSEIAELESNVKTYRIGMYTAVGILLVFELVRYFMSKRKKEQ